MSTGRSTEPSRSWSRNETHTAWMTGLWATRTVQAALLVSVVLLVLSSLLLVAAQHRLSRSAQLYNDNRGLAPREAPTVTVYKVE